MLCITCSTASQKSQAQRSHPDCPVLRGFSVLGTTGIVVNSVIAFVPIGIMVARSIGMNKLFGISLVYIATYTGYNASISAPTSVGLAQRLADVPLLSGIGFRVVIFRRSCLPPSHSCGYTRVASARLHRAPTRSRMAKLRAMQPRSTRPLLARPAVYGAVPWGLYCRSRHAQLERKGNACHVYHHGNRCRHHRSHVCR